ncbi:MAG TPA: hypothetical protein VFW65_12585 [Pseudonocardiaceae bacterium]|nr:hypothetical protein [Pseudonocardiaceae bacterium]
MTDSTTTATNTVTGMVSGPGAVRAQLDQAHEHLAAADRVLTARVPDPVALHAAVDGAIRLANALAGLVTTVMRQAPAGLDHRADPDAAGTGAQTGPILHELLADLRAMHGCLTTGPLLLAPARDDLHRLITHQNTTRATHPATRQDGGPAMRHHKPDHTADGALDDGVLGEGVLDSAPAADVADQQRPARPEPTDDDHDHDEVLEQILNGVGDVLDADPADIAEQRRDAPVLDDTEPWP